MTSAVAATPAHTRAALEAITQAVDAEHDFGGWLADVLGRVAARKGSSDALTAGRPGSWEASLVDQLVKGTVGYDDEYLPDAAMLARSPSRDDRGGGLRRYRVRRRDDGWGQR